MNSSPPTLDSIARRGAAAVLAAFHEYTGAFAAITRRAKARFEERDWHGMQHDAVDRLSLYGSSVAAFLAELPAHLGASAHQPEVWAAMKSTYTGLIADRADAELAATFFNSVSRRACGTVGVDPAVEFLAPPAGDTDAAGAVFVAYPATGLLPAVIEAMLTACRFAVPFDDLPRDAAQAADAVARERRATGRTRPIDAVEVLPTVFYRNQGAYLIGRLRDADGVQPLALALHHPAAGVVVDAVLLTADEVSVVFSFTHSYFHVDTDRPAALIAFLQSIMPLKRTAELYIAIGHNRHGKTELYRELRRHIDDPGAKFEVAAGDRGMVMIVFTLPSYDVVFKIIRDRFAFPKTTSRREVMEKYQLVFRHDRAGRLIDVQEFEHLRFPRDRFADDLLTELQADAADSVTVDGDTVTIRHLYAERRIRPLNLYLLEAGAPECSNAILDYGQAVKDLAATNIFPGDMLLKNFGVTRHGRVVFYDYDELCLVTDCHFRDLPAGRDEDEYAAEPWFYVGPTDIFPEEFIRFLGLREELRATFLRAHGDLLTADYWRRVQERHRAGDLIEITPYPEYRRMGRPQ
ncbi:MAG: bifunctional isocitrate dehydrogenase kinase/phosphatase [Gemmataceae bacterium]